MRASTGGSGTELDASGGAPERASPFAVRQLPREAADRRPGLGAELVAQRAASVVEDLERLGPPPLARERLHQQAVARLPVRLPGGQLGRGALGGRQVGRVERERRGREPVQRRAAHVLELLAALAHDRDIELRQVRLREQLHARPRVAERRRASPAANATSAARAARSATSTSTHASGGSSSETAVPAVDEVVAEHRRAAARAPARARRRPRREARRAPPARRRESVRDEMREQQPRLPSDSAAVDRRPSSSISSSPQS